MEAIESIYVDEYAGAWPCSCIPAPGVLCGPPPRVFFAAC